MLARMLQASDRGLTIIFSRTKRTAAKVADDLAERGFAAAAIHGDLGQGAREQALRAFRNGKVDILVATDVAARGIDVEDVTHVINYQCPEDEKTYLHRIGRTARAGNTGIAVTFVDWDDLPRWGMINKVARPRASPSRRRPTPPRRTCTPTSTSPRAPRAACRARSRPARAWAPRCSRTSARPARAPAGAARPAATATVVAAAAARWRPRRLARWRLAGATSRGRRRATATHPPRAATGRSATATAAARAAAARRATPRADPVGRHHPARREGPHRHPVRPFVVRRSAGGVMVLVSMTAR